MMRLITLVMSLWLVSSAQAADIGVTVQDVYQPVEIWDGTQWVEADLYAPIGNKMAALFSSVSPEMPGPTFRAAVETGGDVRQWSMGATAIEDGSHQIEVSWDGSAWDFVSWYTPTSNITQAPTGFNGDIEPGSTPGGGSGGEDPGGEVPGGGGSGGEDEVGFYKVIEPKVLAGGALASLGVAFGVMIALLAGFVVARKFYNYLFKRV
ncbi:hypothetical protein [Mucisphaera calidilacus]|uniref:Uncharacterized protein n=1 Tax=Mucisphaera calidilacus TaxID=2527982 RepID=A0A518BU25_9BACT|nr:hypothetical protein [Mucisphaera calidilacus]QDU70445.1 hypothetical protein Pan265_02720 [Mucisphaera calidilacus]